MAKIPINVKKILIQGIHVKPLSNRHKKLQMNELKSK